MGDLKRDGEGTEADPVFSSVTNGDQQTMVEKILVKTEHSALKFHSFSNQSVGQEDQFANPSELCPLQHLVYSILFYFCCRHKNVLRGRSRHPNCGLATPGLKYFKGCKRPLKVSS